MLNNTFKYQLILLFHLIILSESNLYAQENALTYKTLKRTQQDDATYNAKEALVKAKKQGKYYTDVKYVRTASGVAYSGMLIALDALMRINNIQLPSKSRKSIEWYRDQIRKMDGKLLNDVNTVYNVLHLNGYYEGLTHAEVINKGIDSAVSVIRKIKPVMN